VLRPALVVSAVLILLARPAGVLACLLPFGWGVREALFPLFSHWRRSDRVSGAAPAGARETG
jgi:NhaP-type Na+/H+ and K+/H+ antiporter